MVTRGTWGRVVSPFVVGIVAAAGVLACGDHAHAADSEVSIAYIDGGEVYSVPSTGGESVNLTHDAASDTSPSWSPDGSRIAFVSDRSGNQDIWVMSDMGENPVNLTSSPEAERDPAWSPDGNRVAYVASLEVKNADGSVTVVLQPSIFVMDLSSGERRQITHPGTGAIPPEIAEWARPGTDGDPVWSPDGTTIAFGRRFSGPTPTAATSYLLTIPADGDGPEVFLTQGGWGIGGLDWSPDSRSIVWSHIGVHATSSWLASLDLGTGTVVDLDVPVELPNIIYPAFNTDGSMLSFTAFSPIDPGAPSGLYVWRIGSSDPALMLGSGSQSSWQPWYESVGLIDTRAGLWTLRSESSQVEFYFGDPGDYPFAGDWNCNGTVTPGLYRQSDGFVYLRNSNTQGIADISFYFGDPGDLPLAGDFDGDGCDTVSIYRPSEERFYIINELGEDGGGLGAAEYSFSFGNPGDKPVVGDWDGDDIDEIGLHRETTGLFYYRNTLTTGIADGQFLFGNPGDRFVAGDWGTADGVETPAMFRPSNTTFYFRHTLTQGNADSQFTWSGPGADWMPVSGPFDLD